MKGIKYDKTQEETPILFEKDGKTYKICWGVEKDSYNKVVFQGDLTAEGLSNVIDNTEYTIGELHEIIIASQMPEEEAVKFLKTMITRLIVEYDSSNEVNVFFISGLPVWLDKETRVGLALRFASEKGMGMTSTALWLNGMQFPFQLELAEQLLGAIEVYASRSYDNTQRHLAEVQKLTSVNDLVSYNYKSGYPEKLRFDM